MPNAKKQATVTDLKERASRAKSIVFAKYTGLSVAQKVKLHSEVKKAGGEVMVTRNRLLDIALDKAAGLTEMLQDQLLTIFSYEDEVSAVKALYNFMKENELPEVKGGYLDTKVLSAKEVDELSKTPGKNELVAMLLNRLQGPGYGLRNVLEAAPRNLVYALQAISQKK